MLIPLAKVLRCGMIFHWPECHALDDPAYAGQTKAKFFVVLRAIPSDQPVVYLLTNSDKPEYQTSRFRPHMMVIAAGSYGFFTEATVINVSAAGNKSLSRAALDALYTQSKIEYVGCLSDADVARLREMVLSCPLVNRGFKKTL